ncbi:hypothetical protein BDZ85DRAFT_296179 [Elsinoe ampelina]|uniref:Uncharacterized protein n=1 Tax=Elsinoe ampelina TaxID=302913 RepID=A0A6A6GB34_9PEZI|nr:hypothetical protein BDZ85DRAFT_296179 [Elsinoe ampelina]
MAAIVVKGVRPTKLAETPPPYYLTSTTGPPPAYCYTCGRLVGSRKIRNAKSSATPSRYCSDRCKAHKPSPSSTGISSSASSSFSLDRVIEDALFLLLSDKDIPDVVASLPPKVRDHHPTHSPDSTSPLAPNHDPAPISSPPSLPPAQTPTIEDTRKRSSRKGDHRLLIPCSLVETVVFGRASNVSRGQGRRRRARDAKEGQHHDRSNPQGKGIEDEYDEAQLLATLGRLRTSNGRLPTKTTPAAPRKGEGTDTSASSDDETDTDDDTEAPDPGRSEGAKIPATQEELDEKRKEGQKRAEQRERVRNACRRAVVFGLREPGSSTSVSVSDPVTPKAKGHGKTTDADFVAKEKSMDDWTSSDSGGGGRKGKKGRKTKGSAGKANGGVQGGKGSEGFAMVDGERRKLCEAVMRGEIVEPSFAKGEWGVRWRETT